MKLNLGCGPHGREGWINIDIDAHPMVVVHDLRQGLPQDLLRSSVDYIYSEHFIEHVTSDQAIHLMRSVWTALIPGGVIRISTPDLMTLCRDYMDQRITRWHPTWNPKTPCRMVNEGMRLWGHRFIYDENDLSYLFYKAGFTTFYRCNHSQSTHPELCDLEIRPDTGDLIMEAVKS